MQGRLSVSRPLALLQIIPGMRPETPPDMRPGAAGLRKLACEPGGSDDPRIAVFALHTSDSSRP
jgi:hypothetical protein